MKTRKFFLFGASILAGLAIAAGLCFLFLGNKGISDIPKTLQVQQMDDDFYLVAQYNGQYLYEFKIEQLMGEKYVTLDTVKTDKNALNLSKQNFGIVAGSTYRFSVCYATENGAVNGEYSSPVNWQPTWNLGEVQEITYNTSEGKISWRELYQAEFYNVVFVDSNSQTTTETTTETLVDTGNVAVGKYTVYVIGGSTNPSILQSAAGAGLEVTIQRQNQILNVQRQDNLLVVTCSEEVKEFEVYVDTNLVGTLRTEQANDMEKQNDNVVYTFFGIEVLFESVDFSASECKIKSNSTTFVGESKKFLII